MAKGHRSQIKKERNIERLKKENEYLRKLIKNGGNR